jgi:hypothetical protein
MVRDKTWRDGYMDDYITRDWNEARQVFKDFLQRKLTVRSDVEKYIEDVREGKKVYLPDEQWLEDRVEEICKLGVF